MYESEVTAHIMMLAIYERLLQLASSRRISFLLLTKSSAACNDCCLSMNQGLEVLGVFAPG